MHGYRTAWCVAWAATGALLVSGLGGWPVPSVATAMQLALVATVTSPWALVQLRRSFGTRAHGHENGVYGGPDVDAAVRNEQLDLAIAGCDDLEEACACFTTEELCLAWRHTFTEVDRPDDPHQRLRVLILREAFLDELERRDPQALHAWLCSQTPAHVAPTAFFARPPDVSS